MEQKGDGARDVCRQGGGGIVPVPAAAGAEHLRDDGRGGKVPQEQVDPPEN